MSRQSKREMEWSRCSDGFADIIDSINEEVRTEKSGGMKRKSSELKSIDASRGNIFEKLGLGQGGDTSSHCIAWSSSDSDKDEVIVSSVKKPRKQPAPRCTSVARRSVTRAQKLLEPEDLDIAQQDSDLEQDVTENLNTSCQDDALVEITVPSDSPVSISVGESQSSSSPVTQTSNTLKASDWVKALQFKTPKKGDNHNCERAAVDDSAEKKKAHSKGGLADQLTRLQTRDKTSMRIWSHQQAKSSSLHESKSIMLQVIGFDNLYSMQLVKCVTKPIAAQSSTATEQEHGNETKFVMFPANQAEQLNLQQGTTFKIFPPWQQLELNGGQEILLCTKYCLVTQPDTQYADVKGATENPPQELCITAKWNCPCALGLCKSATLCPAYQFPVLPGFIQKASTTPECDVNSKDTNVNLLKLSGKSIGHLHTVSKRDIVQHSSESCESLQQLAYGDSLLKSIEDSKVVRIGENDHAGMVGFRGHVHRAVTCVDSTQQKRCHLLVEDAAGTLCELRLVSEMCTLLNFDPDIAEGKTYKFSGLEMLHRVPRYKDAHLFSVLESVWSGTARKTSQESTESESLASLQDFCYVLQASSTDSSIIRCEESILCHKNIAYTQLDVVLQHISSGKPSRISCVVKLLYVSYKEDSLDAMLIYIVDPSVNIALPYVKVIIHPDCYIPENITQSMGFTVIILRDAFVSEGCLQADEWSKISLVSETFECDSDTRSTIDKLKLLSLTFPEVHTNVSKYDLCCVKGSIREVDEESSYRWEVCKYCGSDKLCTGDMESLVKCYSCNKSMDEPCTKMKMEVIVTCDKSLTSVRIDLLQSTIESLLPADEGDDEGYDMSCVLSKPVGPLHCIVTSVENNSAIILKEIHWRQ